MPRGDEEKAIPKYKAKIKVIPNKEAIVEYLVSNQEFIKEKCKHYNDLNEALQENVNKHMIAEVADQYNDEVKSFICEIVALHTNFDAESIMIILEEMDLKEYFKAIGDDNR